MIACDGIWDCFKNDQVAKFIRKNLISRRIRDKKEHIKKMIGELMDKGIAKEVQTSNGIGTDNMTCIVVLFKAIFNNISAQNSPRQINPKLSKPPCNKVESSIESLTNPSNNNNFHETLVKTLTHL